MRECAHKKKQGGVIVRNGLQGNLEVVLYNKESLYGRIDILRNSVDDLAKSIAQQEMLELLKLAPNIYDEPEDVELNSSLAEGSTSR